MGSSKKSSDKDRDREVRKKRRERSRERTKRKSGRDRSKSTERAKERSRSRERRSRSRERRRDRSRSKERKRDRSKSKERGRDRSKSKDRGRDRSKSNERGRERARSKERGRGRARSRSKERRRKERERSPDKQYSKWEESPDASPVNGQEVEEYEEAPAVKREGVKCSERRVGEEEEEEERMGHGQQPATSSSSDATSMSVEASNKLRISLGLKPLQVDTAPAAEEEPETATKKEPVHAPPKNMGDIKALEKLKEKIQLRRETRKISQALGSVKTLGEPNEEEDTESWITRMRRLGDEKRKAEQKAKMLAEMDEEFGIADLISDVVKEDRGKAYGSEALKGLKVEHDVATFKEGRDVTLVIKDAGILDEGEDVLLNLNMVESEKSAKNVELKKRKPTYNPYVEEEVDELGNVQKQTLLSKYDEEIEGEKRKAFVLGDSGEVDTERDREREIIKQRLMDNKISLEMPPVQIASEYYTSEEMVQFKKVKKKRLRKKVRVKADDLVPLGSEEGGKDHGSRSQGSRSESRHVEMDVSMPAVSADDLKDEADSNVDNALTRTRRLMKQSKAASLESKGVAKVVDMLQSRGEEMKEEGEEAVLRPMLGGDGDTIVMDTTAEFCRQVGEEEEIGGTGISGDPYDNTDTRYDKEEEMELEEEGGWMEVREHTSKKKEVKAGDLYQEAEPLVASGVAATLVLAAKKGFVAPPAPKKPASTPAQSSTGKRDIEYERQKEKERDRELSRYGREGSFVEKKGYVPNVKIEHIDDTGRVMSIKEAFRYMSHKFHGRSSGRKKTEKRLKKLKQEHLLEHASSVDTPLNTLSVLKSKQKSAQSPYILVSGGAQSLLAPDIAKRK